MPWIVFITASFFIGLFVAFFAYVGNNDTFLEFREKINFLNIEFIGKMPTEIIFLFSFFSFIVVISIIIKFIRK